MTNQELFSNCDFSEPRRLTGGANRALTAWQNSACGMLAENWQGLLGNNVEITAGRMDSTTALKAVRGLADPGFAARMKMGNDGFESLFAFSERMVQMLVYDMLGTLGEEWPEPQPLTVVEGSMAELLFGEIARSISQAWPEIEPLNCELHSVISRPVRSRLFGPDDVLVRTRIKLTTQFGEEEAVWLLPQTGLESIGIQDSIGLESETGTMAPAPAMKSLAQKIPVQMIVSLGNVTLSLAEMNNLKVGDYLPLDQAVYQPLEGRVDGQLQWIGRPCRMGARQGFQIIAAHSE